MYSYFVFLPSPVKSDILESSYVPATPQTGTIMRKLIQVVHYIAKTVY